MKSDLKERRNAAICKRVNELCGKGLLVMEIYAKVGEEFWLDETTVRNIFANYKKSKRVGNDCSN